MLDVGMAIGLSEHPVRGMGILWWLFMVDPVRGAASMRRYFDPTKYRIIMLINADVVVHCPMPAPNTIQPWIWCAIWKIRTFLGVDQWAVFGKLGRDVIVDAKPTLKVLVT